MFKFCTTSKSAEHRARNCALSHFKSIFCIMTKQEWAQPLILFANCYSSQTWTSQTTMSLSPVCKCVLFCFFGRSQVGVFAPILLHSAWGVSGWRKQRATELIWKSSPVSVNRFVSTSAETDWQGCQTDLFATTMKISVIVSCIHAPSFSPCCWNYSLCCRQRAFVW